MMMICDDVSCVCAFPEEWNQARMTSLQDQETCVCDVCVSHHADDGDVLLYALNVRNG